MNGIQLAYEGRMEMLKAIFGGEEKPADKADEPMTPELFNTLFKGT